MDESLELTGDEGSGARSTGSAIILELARAGRAEGVALFALRAIQVVVRAEVRAGGHTSEGALD